MTQQTAPARGILLILLANLLLAGMDGVSKTLIVDYPVTQILWIRYMAFAGFATVLAVSRGGLRNGLRAGFRTRRPVLHVVRAATLAIEIGLFVVAFRYMQLADTHSIGAVYPLVITALSALVLGETVGPRRWTAVAIGFVGVLVILRPGLSVFQPVALLPLAGAILFGVYQVMTKVVGREDGLVTILLYTGWVGLALTTLTGPVGWVWPDATGWALLMLASVLGVAAHLTIIHALEIAPATVLQPFNYSLLVWATGIGFLVFGDLPDSWTVAGGAIVVAAGLYTWWRERVRSTVTRTARR